MYTTGWEGLTNNVRHMGMFQEVQAMVASREVVVRTRGINPINEEILLICDRNAICIVTAGESAPKFLMLLPLSLHTLPNHKKIHVCEKNIDFVFAKIMYVHIIFEIIQIFYRGKI